MMNAVNETGLKLEFSNGRSELTKIEEINQALSPFGSRLWTLDLCGLPDNIRELLNQRTLNDAESVQIRDHFLLSRERLLKIISQAGRTPQVPGGGQLSTLDLTHRITYPQLYLVAPGADYSRFDRFHVNTSDDGTGVDEVIQVFSRGLFKVRQHLPDQGLINLSIERVEEDSGWIITYDGAYPHIGSISGAQPGTKILVQVIGPAKWEMRYEA